MGLDAGWQMIPGKEWSWETMQGSPTLDMLWRTGISCQAELQGRWGRWGGCLAPHLGTGGAGFGVSCLSAAGGTVSPVFPCALWVKASQAIIAEVRL